MTGKPITREQTRAALVASIQHWEENAAVTEVRSATTGPDGCALCGLFFDDLNCAGCPVASRTGQPDCEGSPYWAAYDARRDYDLRRFHIAAHAELAFLESLLVEFDAETQKMEQVK